MLWDQKYFLETCNKLEMAHQENGNRNDYLFLEKPFKLCLTSIASGKVIPALQSRLCKINPDIIVVKSGKGCILRVVNAKKFDLKKIKGKLEFKNARVNSNRICFTSNLKLRELSVEVIRLFTETKPSLVSTNSETKRVYPQINMRRDH